MTSDIAISFTRLLPCSSMGGIVTGPNGEGVRISRQAIDVEDTNLLALLERGDCGHRNPGSDVRNVIEAVLHPTTNGGDRAGYRFGLAGVSCYQYRYRRIVVGIGLSKA
jgi:hypothetical protein